MSVSNQVIDIDDLDQKDINQVLTILLKTLDLKLVKQTENRYGEGEPSVEFKIVPVGKEVPKTQMWFDDEREG